MIPESAPHIEPHPTFSARVDPQGRLTIPAEMAAFLGLQPGAEVEVESDTYLLKLRRPVTHLAKVYVEPTNTCNLNCRTCIRNTWHVPQGTMDQATYARVIAGLSAFSPPPTVVFSGLGEPLNHPDIGAMVAQAKSLPTRVELITNGTQLTPGMSRTLISAGIDRLWVSLDGATPESFADVRLGAALPIILDNLAHFSSAVRQTPSPRPELGIAFVAMKRNLADLPAVLRLGRQFGATRYSITNVLPYTAEMRAEMLCVNSIQHMFSTRPTRWLPLVQLPKIDLDPQTRPVLHQVMRGSSRVALNGSVLGDWVDRCPFIEAGATTVNWEGNVSPCLPLMHDHTSYLEQVERFSRRYVVGNLRDRSLADLWHDPDYLAFRRRVRDFDFSPCTQCGGCEYVESNQEDCFGSPFPTCGGCLWAQGVIQCP